MTADVQPAPEACAECGYPLRGVAGPVCPECGTARGAGPSAWSRGVDAVAYAAHHLVLIQAAALAVWGVLRLVAPGARVVVVALSVSVVTSLSFLALEAASRRMGSRARVLRWPCIVIGAALAVLLGVLGVFRGGQWGPLLFGLALLNVGLVLAVWMSQEISFSRSSR